MDTFDTWVCALAVIGLMVGLMMWRDDVRAMRLCEIEHSHDVCFQALNP